MDDYSLLDEETKATLKRIHTELELDDAVDYEIAWQDVKALSPDPVDLILGRVFRFKEKIYKRFRKSKVMMEELLTGRQ